MINNSVVNIIIPGAPKAGTTSITAILNEHKEIFVPAVKEPRYFIKDELQNLRANDPLKKYLLSTSIFDWNKYKSVYNKDVKYKVDSSVQYLYHYKTAIKRIKEHLGDPVIIIILRDPIIRAWSNFNFNQKSERCIKFMDAIHEELNGQRDDLNSFYHYYKQSLYFEAIQAYFQNFSNVKVLFYEDFCTDNLRFVNELLHFLGLEKFEVLPQVPKLNTSSELTIFGKLIIGKYSIYNIASKTIFRLFYSRADIYQKKLRLSAKFSKKISGKKNISDSDIRELLNLFREDNIKLKQLLKISELPWESIYKSYI